MRNARRSSRSYDWLAAAAACSGEACDIFEMLVNGGEEECRPIACSEVGRRLPPEKWFVPEIELWCVAFFSAARLE